MLSHLDTRRNEAGLDIVCLNVATESLAPLALLDVVELDTVVARAVVTDIHHVAIGDGELGKFAVDEWLEAQLCLWVAVVARDDAFEAKLLGWRWHWRRWL